MLKFFLLLFLSLSLYAKSDIESKISTTSHKISSKSKQYSKLNSQMKKNANAILKQKRAYKKLNKRLKQLALSLSLKEDKYKSNKKALSSLEKSQLTLLEEQSKLEEEIIFAIARNISLSMLLKDDGAINADSLIHEEVLKSLQNQNKKKIRKLNSRAKRSSQKIDTLSKEGKKLMADIELIDKKRVELNNAKRKNKKLLASLSRANKKYKKSISKILNQKKSLNKTLSRLHIIKENETERKLRLAKERADKKKIAQASKNVTSTKEYKVSNNNLPKVKRRGSSYQYIKSKRYRGKKTISPLDSYTLVKKFGPYTDPVYGIKIYNESVSLRPKQSASKVKAVLNGKVILAKYTAMLNNVVIIEHANGIHTIYAHLDKIAPNIKDGKRLKKGSVIGRVDNELMFEVTQKNYHINPMQLIK